MDLRPAFSVLETSLNIVCIVSRSGSSGTAWLCLFLPFLKNSCSSLLVLWYLNDSFNKQSDCQNVLGQVASLSSNTHISFAVFNWKLCVLAFYKISAECPASSTLSLKTQFKNKWGLCKCRKGWQRALSGSPSFVDAEISPEGWLTYDSRITSSALKQKAEVNPLLHYFLAAIFFVRILHTLGWAVKMSKTTIECQAQVGSCSSLGWEWGQCCGNGRTHTAPGSQDLDEDGDLLIFP